jgi:hypothetical protein
VKRTWNFSLIGGFAAKQYGVSYVTEDVDICVRFSCENLKRIEQSVHDLHPRYRLAANRLPLELTEELCARLKNLYLRTDIGVLKCLGDVAGIGDFDAVLKESELREFPFGQCYVITIPALIRAKEAVGRTHDILTVKQLRAIQENRNSTLRQGTLPL